jgi:hypothetical protein
MIAAPKLSSSVVLLNKPNGARVEFHQKKQERQSYRERHYTG